MKNLLLPAILLLSLSFQSGKMVKTNLTDQISCLLPANFYPMSENDMARRLPSIRSPLASYTDESRLVDFSVNASATQWQNSDIALAKEFYKASIFNLYDEVKMIQEEMKIINKKEFAVFEFESMVKGDGLTKKAIRKYTFIQYYIYNGQAYVFAFNSPVPLKDKWKNAVHGVMESIKIK